MKRTISLLTIVLLSAVISIAQENTRGRWTEEKANNWYEQVTPIKGFNFLPSTAVNSTDMWQEQSFDPKTIRKELAWAKKAGYNSARVFLQFLVWEYDPVGLKNRINEFLSIADQFNITVMFVLFDDCAFAGKEPYLGKQDDPVPGVHNSGWTPSPGPKKVVNKEYWSQLENYVKDVVGVFKNDKRVVVWDMYNEPGNSKMWEKSLPLVEASFRWAREMNPIQPLTVAPYGDFYNIFSKNSLMTKRFFELSDVISFHAYETPDKIEEKVNVLINNYDRPLICTEWLKRQDGGTFENILPIFAKNKVSWYQWGLVAGETQTYMHWGSKKGDPEPDIWQHDVFHKDGKPYDPKELGLVKQFEFLD
ncbi:MAG: 1,4-beta-xylanase [Deltaproteobacteria bacterium]|nr:1,4-beta-xylanase [Deltaproteobacteria bacterium]